MALICLGLIATTRSERTVSYWLSPKNNTYADQVLSLLEKEGGTRVARYVSRRNRDRSMLGVFTEAAPVNKT